MLPVGDFNFPYLGSFTDVYGLRYTGHETFAYALDMIGVDVEPDTILPAHIDAAGCSNTAQCFGQHNGSTAMQKSHGLVRAVIDRHFCFNKIFPDLGKLNAQVCNHRVYRHLIEGL